MALCIVPPDQIGLALEAQRAPAGGIGEGANAFGVDAVNGLAG
jgi:hypothetical protein